MYQQINGIANYIINWTYFVKQIGCIFIFIVENEFWQMALIKKIK